MSKRKRGTHQNRHKAGEGHSTTYIGISICGKRYSYRTKKHAKAHLKWFEHSKDVGPFLGLTTPYWCQACADADLPPYHLTSADKDLQRLRKKRHEDHD